MKVIHLFHTYLSTTENWCYNLIKNLPDSQLTIVSKNIVNEGAFPLPTADFFILPLSKDISKFPSFLKRCIGIFRYLFFFLWIRYYLVFHAKKSDIIHAHFSFIGWEYLILSEKTGVPLIISFYGFDYEWLPRNEPVWKDRYKILFDKASLFLTEGTVGREKLIKMGCPEEKVKVSHLGVEVSNIPFYLRKKDRNELRLVQVATFAEKKGHETTIKAFIKAIKTCPNMSLSLVGKDPEGIRSSLQKIIRDSGIEDRIEFIDWIDFAKLHEFLKDFQVFIHPSKYSESGDSEGGAPIVLLDAQATGMPVLSTTHCDIPGEVINGVTGILVEENDVDGLAKGIKTFYEMDKAQYHSYCKNARKHVEDNFDAVKCAIGLKKIYDYVIKSKNMHYVKAAAL